jgi:ABC-type branched-subunit amino acid transport system ATPase component
MSEEFFPSRVLMAKQNFNQAIKVADRAYVMVQDVSSMSSVTS